MLQGTPSMVTLAAGSRRRRRSPLSLEALESRELLTGGYTVQLSPEADQFGDQILTVQAYNDSNRLAFGIFDTGSAAMTFAAQDQARFEAKGRPIPIQDQGGGRVSGIGGLIEGDISAPGTIFVDGMHAASVSFDQYGAMTVGADFSGAVATKATRALVGTYSGSPQLPTLSGAPVLQAGRSALIDFRGVEFNLDNVSPGLNFSTPDLRFVGPGTKLHQSEGSTEPFTVPLSSFGGLAADGITQGPVPLQSDVLVTLGHATAAGKRFLFDTGAQMTVLSTRVAQALGLDLNNPSITIGANGASGQSDMGGYVLDRLTVPSDQGPLSFSQVPVFVADLMDGFDGILGMNLFNTALELLISAGGASFSVTFEKEPTSSGPLLTEPIITALGGLGIPIAENIDIAALPTISVPTGEATGYVFQDLDGDGRPDRNEPGYGDQLIFVDYNHNGIPDREEPWTRTNSQGQYKINYLPPGDYILRLVTDATVPVAVPDVIPVAIPPVDVSNPNPIPAEAPPVQVAVQAVNTTEVSARVSSLYAAILNRLPDGDGKLYWEELVRNGVTFDNLAQTFWESAEHRGMQIDTYYEQYLGRPSDREGRAYWISSFLKGASEVAVQQGILTSPEYLSKHASDIAYVQGLYNDALNRSPDPAGASYWLTLLQAGVARTQIAKGILGSTEALLQGVDAFYQQFLDRDSDEAGRAYWFSVLQHGQATWSSVALSFLTSEEFLRKQRDRVSVV